MERTVKKIDPVTGQFALRNYEVEKCIKAKDVMHCKHGDEVMTMDPESLISKQIGRSKELSDVNGPFYLIDYIWDPNLYGDD